MSEASIIARTKTELETYNAPEGTLVAHRLDLERDGLDRYLLGLDYPERKSISIECPRDFERILLNYFDTNPEVSGISVSITRHKKTFKTFSRETIKRQDEDRADALKLQKMRDLNKTMFTGRPGEVDYDPNSTTPIVSDEELKEFTKKLNHCPRDR